LAESARTLSPWGATELPAPGFQRPASGYCGGKDVAIPVVFDLLLATPQAISTVFISAVYGDYCTKKWKENKIVLFERLAAPKCRM